MDFSPFYKRLKMTNSAVIASYFSQKRHDDNFINGITTTLSSSVMKTLSKWLYGYSFKRLANFLRFEV